MARVGVWLRDQVRTRARRARVRMRAWLRQHPKARATLARSGSLDVDEFTLARGVAVGLFIGLTPTLGFQTPLMLGASIAMRANFPAAFLVSWINNPFTVAFLYLGFHQLGEWVMESLPFRFDSLFSGLARWKEDLAEDTLALVIGSLCLAVPVALIGYFLFLYLWRRFDLHLPKRPGVSADSD
jgi:uncharacterized protein